VLNVNARCGGKRMTDLFDSVFSVSVEQLTI